MCEVVPDAKASSNDHDRCPLDAVYSLELLNAPQSSFWIIRIGHGLLDPIFIAYM